MCICMYVDLFILGFTPPPLFVSIFSSLTVQSWRYISW